MKIEQQTITLSPKPRGFHLITREISESVLAFRRFSVGIAHIMVLHTSAGLTINENADPDVRVDFETIMNRLVPENAPGYTHTMEGPDDMPAHVKASLVGSSVTVPIRKGELLLGTWQGIYLCEFRNRGGARRLTITITGETEEA